MDASLSGRWRYELLFGLLAAALLALTGRVVWLQTKMAPQLAAMANQQERRMIVLPARPGNIFIRNRTGYTLVAGSQQVPSCFADPELIPQEQYVEVARRVAKAAGANEDELLRKLVERSDRRFAYLLRDITDEQAAAIRKLNIRGVGITHNWKREYPNGALAGQIIGIRRVDGQPGGGLELYHNRYLAAHDGLKILRCDAARRGTYAETIEYEAPEDGKALILTIDATIQGYLEQAIFESREKFGAKAVMGVVMDPMTGAVLAMASSPNFDPNFYPGSTPEERTILCISSPYEPGSAFKPVIASGAIEMQKSTLATQYFCHYGCWPTPHAGIIRDAPGESFGMMPLSEIIIHSSNIGMAELGDKLGADALYTIARAFGFGQKTGIDLPGESGGMLINPRRWNMYDTLRCPFGQGPISVTALQLCTAYSAIANGGVLYKPRIVDRIVDADGKVLFENPPLRVRRVLSSSNARKFVDEALFQVVERGTGKNARLDQHTEFGKTGTAQIGTSHGYVPNGYTGTFVGGAPVKNPAAVCLISVYHPDYSKGHYGGTVAAPYVKDVLNKTMRYLDVPPDRQSDEVAGRRGVASVGADDAGF